MDMQKYLSLFVSEANEHIQEAGQDVARMAETGWEAARVHSLFRHFHSIKGMAASMGFEPIAALSHALEDLFDRLRKGEDAPKDLVAEAVLEAIDATSSMVAAAARGGAEGDDLPDPTPIIEKIRGVLPQPVARAAGADGRLYRCFIGVDPGAQLRGPRAAIALKQLESLGRVITCDPGREALTSPDFPGELSVLLATDRSESAVVAALKDILDLQRIEIREEVPAAGAMRPGAAPAKRAAGPAETAEAEPAGPSTLRINTEMLDLFLESLSEMMARRGALAEALKSSDLRAAREAMEKLSASLDGLREKVMVIRLLSFDHITPRLGRTLRDLCRRTGKRVSLRITGAEVSLDRSVLEALIDPLNHILRNAVDHGIEMPEQREALGKPAAGTVLIEISRSGHQVLVAVQDDGKGFSLEAIRRAALAGGFATEAELAAMDEQRTLMLTTIPGFSTASSVTEVSGRGVGMDVVRTRIEALGGHMQIRSRSGEGTRIEMALPLTVAVMDAFLVGCRAGVFAVPASCVSGVQLAEPARIRSSLSGSFLAGQEAASSPTFIPLLTLDEVFGALPASSPEGLAESAHCSPPASMVLTYQMNGVRGALAVDTIIGRLEVVVKPLGMPLEKMRKYSGAALLDDGRVALILDLANLSRV
jgi:two-component system chemotaxis sensor kinase CheA